jgi:hypothetical protein
MNMDEAPNGMNMDETPILIGFKTTRIGIDHQNWVNMN